MKRFAIILLPWIPAFFTGWYFIEALTVHPTRIFISVFIFTVLLCMSLMACYFSLKRKMFIWSLSGMLFLLIAGYLVRAKIFLSAEDSRFVPAITRLPETKGDHKAVVYFTHGEPETFNPIGWLNQFREFDEQGIRFVPFFARPFFINGLREKYLEVGKSNHRQGHMVMLKDLEALYRMKGDSSTRFYLSFLDDEPRPDAAVIRALNEGASEIIVATVFLTMSNHTAEGWHLVEKLESEKRFGVKTVNTEPLWNSETLMRAFVDKVYQNLGSTSKDKVGIALIGHGQPDEWDVEFPTETLQEAKFRESIIEMFSTEGFKKENMGDAWMSFKKPKPYELMEKLVRNGVEKIFYFSSAISADAIHSQSDIPELVNEYPFPEGIEVVNLGAWNAHPLVIQAIREKIDQVENH